MLLVSDALVEGIVVFRLEGHIREVHKDDQSFLLPYDGVEITYASGCQTLHAMGVGLVATGLCPLRDGLGIHHLISPSPCYFMIGLAIEAYPVVGELIAY